MKITVSKVLSGLMIAVSFSCFATMEAAWDLDENGNDSVEAQALHEKCPSHVLIKSKSGKVVDHDIKEALSMHKDFNMGLYKTALDISI